MKITKTNYELYFIDYMDGNLSPEQEKELKAFLVLNPELEEELNSIRHIKLPADSKNHTLNKNLLLRSLNEKTVSENNFDEFCIADLEQDLSTHKSKELQQYINAKPESELIYRQYAATKLKPRIEEYFPNKRSLKKPVPFTVSFKQAIPYWAAAAVLATASIIWFNKPTENSQIAANNNRNEQVVDSTITISKPVNVINNSDKKENIINKEPVRKNYFENAKTHNKKELIAKVNEVKKPVETIDPLQKLNTIQVNPIHKVDAISNDLAVINTLPNVKSSIAAIPEPNYMTVGQLLVKAFKKNVLKENPDQIDINNFTMWDVADAGVKGINKLTGWNVAIDKELNEYGEVKKVEYRSGLINYTKTLD